MKGTHTCITSPFPKPHPEHHALLLLVWEGGTLGSRLEWMAKGEGMAPRLSPSYLSLFQEVVELLEEEFSES